MKYLLLTDREHQGVIIRAVGEIWHRFYPEKGWVETGILIKYFCDESPLYNSYREISEEEAMKLIQSAS